MSKYLFLFMLLIQHHAAFSKHDTCMKSIHGYKVVEDSAFPFVSNKERACFFAFYVENKDLGLDSLGNENYRDAIWYAYYKANEPTKIIELPKPDGDRHWRQVCNIDAVSFYSMHNKNQSDITVIGSCDNNPVNYTFSFVFYLKDGKYVLDEGVYKKLYGFIALTVADIREYVKSPETQYKKLKRRNDSYL